MAFPFAGFRGATRPPPFTSTTRSLDSQLIGFSPASLTQDEVCLPLSLMLNILSSSHSPLTHSPGCPKSCCPLRSLSRACFLFSRLVLFSVVGWARSRGPFSGGFPLGPQLVSPSLVSPSVFRSWLFFSAFGYLLGRWLSLPEDGRGVGRVSSRSLVRLGLGSLSPPALVSVLAFGFLLWCYSPDAAEPGRKGEGHITARATATTTTLLRARQRNCVARCAVVLAKLASRWAKGERVGRCWWCWWLSRWWWWWW